MDHQAQATPKRGLPVEMKNASSSKISVSGESIPLYYDNDGVLTLDAGQSIDTLVIGVLDYCNIRNQLGTAEASKNDTSLSFTSTAFITEVEIDWAKIESLDYTSVTDRIRHIGALLDTGEYVVDYATGTIYGKKASTQISLVAGAYIVVQSSMTATVTVDSAKTGSPDGGTTKKFLKVDGSDQLIESNSVAILASLADNETPTNIDDNRKEVAIAGTAETLVAASTVCKYVLIQAELNNTGVIVVGDSTVVAAEATRRGYALDAGDPVIIPINDAQKIYLDTTVNTDGVTFILFS